jgi:hypothetical protein
MLGIAKAREEGGKVGQDLKWIDELRDRPWPFKTEELILVYQDHLRGKIKDPKSSVVN